MKRFTNFFTLSTLLVITSCSVTRHLPDGEVAYMGVKDIAVEVEDTLDVEVETAVNTLLKVNPKDKGLFEWMKNNMKGNPMLVSQVNPELRCRAAEMAMKDEGYFAGQVDYEMVPNRRNPKKAKVAYTVSYGKASRLSSVEYLPNQDARVDRIVANTRDQRLIHVGDRFSATRLLAEKNRLGALMVDSGYFYYTPALVRYLADSTQTPYGVALKVCTDYKASAEVLRPCRVDSVSIKLERGSGLKPKYLEPCLAVEKGELYNNRIGRRITTRLARLNTFKYNNVEWKVCNDNDNENHHFPDTTSLLLSLTSTYHLPWSGSYELKAVYKDNDQVGPGLAFMAQRRNLFGGGELLTFGIDAGYEWNTGKHTIGENNGLLNSYELGSKVSLAIPRLQLPLEVDEDLPVTTTYSLSADVMSRAGFFKMFKATGELSYSFSTSPVNTHILTPLQLTYTSLLSTTHRFDSIVGSNRVLKQSFADQFIPSIRYTYIYDNSSIAEGNSRQRLQVSLVEAGGILDGIMGQVGAHRQQGERQFLWQPFSQFVKASVDLRNYIDLGHRQTLAMRALGGVAYAYGNSETVPYSEQFFIGGANSLRGFSIRSVGPGTFKRHGDKYAYLDQTGDVKLEANVEWRFPLTGDLYGALFADAGNVWTLRDEDSRSGGQLTSTFLSELATDCGFGLRYDLGMLVLRFDIGVPLHDPCESNGKYYNPSGSFFGNLGYHLAIGYPF